MSISEPSHSTGAYASSNYTQGELGKADCKPAGTERIRNPSTECRNPNTSKPLFSEFGFSDFFRTSDFGPRNCPYLTALGAPKSRGIEQVPVSLRARLRRCAAG